ncbi:ATP-binding protein [Pectobacterium carotovorum]|uniref:HD domain-containing protein n=1 Tax=Pectobacterium carotovorum TaxID=554 RepID=UPI0030185955
MSDLSKIVAQSSIWRSTLAQQDSDTHETERERLRSSFMSFRGRVSLLALEIAKDLPDLTVHDISHLDALWEVGSQIIGPNFSLTPAEGYVLGGSILLHDLAMSIAATPGGIDAMRKDVRWRDSLFAFFQANESRDPTHQEIESPGPEARQFALFSLLRQLHAESAERLAFSQFGTGASTQYLIEDTELRQTFGRIIGQIAHSHWWSLAEVERQFDRHIGAPHWAPSTWTIDPLKVACILRAADAAHIDARRAPSFQKIFSNINPASQLHWDFQERLNKSYVSDDALVFTSGQAFSLAEVNAWWLCLDTLRMVDSELRGIDSLLSDRSMVRFSARRVAGVDHPERLAQYIQTTDWHPIHAAVHLSDLPNVIRSLGGEELYGKNPTTPLRELIQNSNDAIRARRCYEGRQDTFGEVAVELIEDSGSFLLRVQDNGIGMSRRVLTQYLLDFGTSFWSKPQVQEEFPGLLSSGFRSSGKYGIGFFSVFMASDKVKIVTRRPDAAASETLVLEFGSGLNGRPILRPARRDEQLRDGGTVVQLTLRKAPHVKGGLLWQHFSEDDETTGDEATLLALLACCRRLAPTVDVKLTVTANGDTQTAIDAQDWIRAPGEELLLERCPEPFENKFSREDVREFAVKASDNLRVVNDAFGCPIARICITAADRSYALGEPTLAGAITVGGFFATRLQGIAGFMIGEATRASRDSASPIMPKAQLATWATEQAALVPSLYKDPESQASAAQTIRICGGHTGELPIAMHAGDWLNASQITELDLPNQIIILDWFLIEYELKHAKDLVFDHGVFITSASGLVSVFQDRSGSVYCSGFTKDDGLPVTLLGAVVEAAARRWNVQPTAVLAANNFEREHDVRIGQAVGKVISTKAYVVSKPES